MIGADTIGSHLVASTALLASPGKVFKVFINGVNVTDNVFFGAGGSDAVTVNDILTGASTAELSLNNVPGDIEVEVGHEVIIEHKIGRIFGGTIEDVRLDNPGSNLSLINYSLTLKDYSGCLERRLVAASLEDTGDPITQTAGDVIRTIHGLVLADGCIFLGEIEDGPLIQKINFNYVTALRALNDIQKLTGNTFQWHVDFWGVLTFRAREAVAAPYEITGADEVTMRALDFEESRETYRNRQTVRGGKTTSDPRTDNFEADGKNKTFVCSLPLAGKPTIELDSVAVDPDTIGIKGADEDDPLILWFYAIDDPDVSARTAPVVTTDVDITYQGLFPIIVQRELPAEIAAREALEPGDGIYEKLEVDENLDLLGARAIGDGLLEKYGRIPKRVNYLTQKEGHLQAGQLQRIEFSRFGASRVAADYMIDSVNLAMLGEDVIEYSVSATEGKELLEWLEFWRQVISGRAPFLLRDNEKIILPLTLNEQIDLTDTVQTDLSNELTNYEEDPYTVPIFNIGKSIGKKIEDGSSDGPHLGPILGEIGLLAGLVFYYAGEETGTTADRVDSHTNGLDMSVTGTMGAEAGALGLCPSLGSSPANYLDRAHDDLFRIGAEPATISGWLRINTGQEVSNHPIINHHNTNGGATERGWLFRFRTSPDDRVTFNVSDDGIGTNTALVTSPIVTDDNTWHLYTAYHDPDNARIGMQVDAGSITWVAWAPAVVNPTCTARPAWGYERLTAINKAFAESDEVCMHRRILTGAEVTRMYNGGTPLGYANFR